MFLSLKKKNYNNEVIFSHPAEEEPEIYDEKGNKKRLFYLRDNLMDPYSKSRYFEWDRANYGLKTHFYCHNHMLEMVGNPNHRYGMLVESKAIVPDNYKIFKKYPWLSNEYDTIFTYDDEILNSVPNAKFFPSCAEVWYRQDKSYIWDDRQFEKKDKKISMISSDKSMCNLHEKRKEIARNCRNRGIADVYGTIDGGQYVSVDVTLERYMYSIVIENDITDYFFTERITSCFASQTIPIYVGARKIYDFFNPEGMIMIEENKIDSIYEIINMCTIDYYKSKIEAILDNYNRVQSYRNVFDWLYENYEIK